jgi:hypothetical protein
VADLVGVRFDASDAGVDILTDDFLGEPDDPITDGTHRLPQGGLPQQSCPPPSGERHDRPPLHHEAILEREDRIVNWKW